jgi:hypothetical protein
VGDLLVILGCVEVPVDGPQTMALFMVSIFAAPRFVFDHFGFIGPVEPDRFPETKQRLAVVRKLTVVSSLPARFRR